MRNRVTLLRLTSPNGNVAVALEEKNASVFAQTALRETAGVAPAAKGIVTSSYDGLFGATTSAMAWGQHIVRLAG